MFRAITPRFFKPNASMLRSVRPGVFASFASKTNNSDPFFETPSKNQTDLREKIKVTDTEDKNKFKKISLTIQPTQKEHLKRIQDHFDNLQFSFEPLFENMAKTRFIFSNDFIIPGYLTTLHTCFSEENKSKTIYHLSDALRSRKPTHHIGVVIGNGAILSLLPEIPASDILLLDIEPAVHLFVLQVKKLILECEDYEDFSTVQQTLIEKINQLAQTIKPSKESELASEMEQLGVLHFLATKERFKQCRDALLKKELIPININVFCEESMDDLKKLLIKSNCQISFMNLTNVAEYDDDKVLFSRISKMPFSDNFNVLLTSHFIAGKCSYHAKNLNDVKKILNSIGDYLAGYDISHAALNMLKNYKR